MNFRKTAISGLWRITENIRKAAKKFLLLMLLVLYLFAVDFLFGKDLLKTNNEMHEPQNLDINNS